MIAPGRRTHTKVPAQSTPASTPATSHMNARNAAAHARPHTAPAAAATHGVGHEVSAADPLRDGTGEHENRQQRRGVQANPDAVRGLQGRGVGRQDHHQ